MPRDKAQMPAAARRFLIRPGVFAILVLVALVMLPASGVAAVPGNDDFANATTIGSLPFTGTASVEGATTQVNEPFICTYMPQTIWYSYQPPTSGYYKVGLSSDVTDSFLQICSGSSLDQLSNVGCLFAPEQFFYLQAGSTYYFQVGTQSVEAGSYSFQ